MPINVSWGDKEQTYVYIHVIGNWTWHEYHSNIELANELIESVDHKVCVITHMVDSQAQILAKNAFGQWRKSLGDTPSNLQMVILVPGILLVQAFIDTIHRLFGQFLTFKFRMALTLDDAEQIVKNAQQRKVRTRR